MDSIILSLLILAAVTLLITQHIRAEVTALLIIATLAMTGILTPEEAISGFSSSATVTVAGMFILSAGLIRTGALDMAVTFVLRFAQESQRRLFLLLTALVATTRGVTGVRPQRLRCDEVADPAIVAIGVGVCTAVARDRVTGAEAESSHPLRSAFTFGLP